MRHGRLLFALSLVLTCAAKSEAQLGADSALASRIAALEAEVTALRQSASSPMPAVCCPLPPVAKPSFPTARLSGLVQTDAGWAHQTAANIASVGDIQDGADFRRARLAAIGNVADNVAYMVEFDFGLPGRPSFMDVWLDVQNLGWFGQVKIGNYRQPIGLDGLTSVKELTFIERSLPFAFLPFRQIGVMTYGAAEDLGVTWALSGFRFPTDVFGGQVGDNGGYGLASRLTGLVLEGADGSALHLGGAYNFIDPANDAVQYLAQPEFFLSETGGALVPPGVPSTVPPFVDTGVIATNSVNLFGAEMAGTSGPLHAQAELIYAVVDRIGGSTVAFSGVSAQAGWILTGEHRPYNRKNGVLGRVVPANNFGAGGGAWEVAARWSMLDLNSADVRGGQLNTTTLGLNWYLNQFTKLQFNYIHAFLDDPANVGSDADLIAARAHFDF
ncbi:MAG: porin [Planctomycetales bacterium]|nr:porin [Planctomycetales bacterium]